MASEGGTRDAARSRCLSVAPGMPTTDMQRTIRHYEKLGFVATLKGDEFSILERDGVELHFALKRDHDPRRTATWIYVRVEDADAIHRELKAAGVEGLREAHDTDYKMRETPYVDPDNNLILFGSPLPSCSRCFRTIPVAPSLHVGAIWHRFRNLPS